MRNNHQSALGGNEGVPLANQSSDETANEGGSDQIRHGTNSRGAKLLLTEHRHSYKYAASNEPSTKSTSEATGV